jgi:hypothetical protein
MNPSLAVDADGALHVVWEDGRNGQHEVYYRMLESGGIAGLDPGGSVGVNARVNMVPNPVTQSTRINFQLSRRAPVEVSIHDVTGRTLWRQDAGTLQPGRHSLVWQRTDAAGEHVSPGVYFVSVKEGNRTSTAKLVVLR